MPTGGNWALTSNLTVDTNVLAIDITNDRVGVGTTSPAYRLDVAGDVRSTGLIQSHRATGTDPAFAAQVTGDTYARWQVNADGSMEFGRGSAARRFKLQYNAVTDSMEFVVM